MMQVENESGLLGSVRDYSAESNKLFNGPVPASLVTALREAGDLDGGFGSRLAEESFTTYYLSSFINEIAKAGKQVYPLATYVNAWEGGEDTADAFDSLIAPARATPAAAGIAHARPLEGGGARHRHPFRGHFRAARRQLSHDQRAATSVPTTPTGAPRRAGPCRARVRFSTRWRSTRPSASALMSGFRRQRGVGGRLCRPGRGLPLDRCAMPAVTSLQAAGKLKAAIADDTIRVKNLIFDRYHLLVRFLAAPGAPAPSPTPGGPPPSPAAAAACWWASWGRTSF